MKLTFKKEDLLKGIQSVQSIAGGRNTLPILSNVLIETHEDRIEISATDLEVSLVVDVFGDVIEAGAVTMSARKLSDIVRELPDDEITLSSNENNRVTISCGEGNYTIIGMPSDDFPEIPKIGEKALVIDGETLCEMISKTEFAAALDDARYFLNGLYFNLTHEMTEIVGTDGRRLAVASNNKTIIDQDEPISVTVPLKAVKQIAKMFSESVEVEIQLNENQIVFTEENACLTSRLVDGEYPKYQNIIPQDHEVSAVFNVEALLGCLKRVSLLSNPKTFSIRLDIVDENASFSSQSPELGEAQESIEVKQAKGNIEIAFDARFITDAVGHIQTEHLVMEFKDSASAVVLKPVGKIDHLCLVMPMRLDM